jgi:hypothetical protein
VVLCKLAYAAALLVGIPSGGWLIAEAVADYQPSHTVSTVAARQCENVTTIGEGGMRFCLDADLDTSGVEDLR